MYEKGESATGRYHVFGDGDLMVSTSFTNKEDKMMTAIYRNIRTEVSTQATFPRT